MFGYDADDDSGSSRPTAKSIRRYQPEQIRFLVHWNAEVYADMDEVKKVMDHTDDLTHERVVGHACSPTCARRGVKVDRAVRSAARRRTSSRR